MPRLPTKKSLGQHFLYNTHILELMAEAGNVSAKDLVVEIGPGEGTLTSILGARDARVIAIEKDHRLIQTLQETVGNKKNVSIIEGDIMKLSPDTGSLAKLLSASTPYKIIANIPYYITGRFLKLFLEAKHKPSSMTLMVQKEIAERIVARDKKESVLSLSVKIFGEPSIIKIVPRGAFSPPPKVDSAILHIGNISDSWFLKHKIIPRDFFLVIKRAFGQKRKTLRASLGKNYHIPEQFSSRRPETLSLEEWAIILHGLL